MSDTIPQEEEWITAAQALALVGLSGGARAICKRAAAGLVRARAERLTGRGKSEDDCEVPEEFWRGSGGGPLHQDWERGDFGTWINHTKFQAFGVRFRLSDIEHMRPEPFAPKPLSAADFLEPSSVRGVLAPEPRYVPSQAQALETKVFIGHGRSLLWHQLKDFLRDDLELEVEEFNSVSAAGISTVSRLKNMLDAAAFAFLILTAEDETPDGEFNAV